MAIADEDSVVSSVMKNKMLTIIFCEVLFSRYFAGAELCKNTSLAKW